MQHDQSYGKDLEANNPDYRRGQSTSRKISPGTRSTSDYVSGDSVKMWAWCSQTVKGKRQAILRENFKKLSRKDIKSSVNNIYMVIIM